VADTRTEASPVVSILLGGRKLVGLAMALLVLWFGPAAAAEYVVMLYGVYVGGNGWEHQTRRAKPAPQPKQPAL
jgi:hypothetical protein